MVRALADAAPERGISCTVVYGRRPETPSNPADWFDPRVRMVEVPGWGERNGAAVAAEALRAARILRGELARHDGGVLHLHSSFAGVVGRLVAPARGWRVFYSPHAYGFLNDSLGRPVRLGTETLERFLGRRGRTIAVSEAEGEAAARIVGGGRVITVPNGVDLPPKITPPPDGRFTVLSIGRALYQRRTDLVAEVARTVTGELPSTFVWVGDGPERETLAAAGVEVAGWLPRAEVAARLDEAHVVLHLAAFEGLPLAVLEAMAAGRPVVATDLPALREAIGDAGILVSNAGEAADALCGLAADEELRRHLGERGRERVKRLFSRDVMVERTFAAYGFGPSEDGS